MKINKIDRKALLSNVCKIANKISRAVSRNEAFFRAWKTAKNNFAKKRTAVKQETEFDRYVNMIRSCAHYYARCYKMDYEDVEAQGFLIYCMSLKDYNKKRASFSTFLYRNLSGRLRDYCRMEAKAEDFNLDFSAIFNPKDLNIDFGFGNFPAREFGPDIEQLLLYAKSYLTPGCYKIFKWLLDDQLVEFRSKVHPSLATIAKTLNIELDALKAHWKELFDFWDLQGVSFYASN
jgi:hypothetical protein